MKTVQIETIKAFLIDTYKDAVFLKCDENKSEWFVTNEDIRITIEITEDKEIYLVSPSERTPLHQLAYNVMQAEQAEKEYEKETRLNALKVDKEAVQKTYPAMVEELERNNWNLLNARMLTFNPLDWYLIVTLCQNNETGEYCVHVFNADRGFFAEGYYTREYFVALKKYEDKR